MARRVCVIPGDGIGPEVIAGAVRVLDAAGADVEIEEHPAGLACRERHGEYLPSSTIAAARASDAVLFGAITSPLAHEDPTYRSVILDLRLALDLYANVRPARDLGQPCLAPGLDLVLVRENTEGLYHAVEVEDSEGVTTHRRITRRATERVARFAFAWCERRGRKRLTCVHKANVIRKGDGLFRDAFFAVARDHPAVAADEILVDNCALQLVRAPRRFDALLAENLYGDILSDEMAGLVGGLGFAPSGSFGPRHALFEPVHGSAPDIAGKNVANPAAAILSAAMMLDHLGDDARAARVEAAVRDALERGRTADVGGSLSTTAFTDLVVAALA